MNVIMVSVLAAWGICACSWTVVNLSSSVELVRTVSRLNGLNSLYVIVMNIRLVRTSSVVLRAIRSARVEFPCGGAIGGRGFLVG